jgi:hypothetical protein
MLHQFPQLRPGFPTFSPVSVQQQGWTVPALRNHLHRAISNLGQGDALTLYIDALDECEKEDIREAIEHFEELGSAALPMPISLHICFSSRRYPRVSIQHCIEILVEEQAKHEQDIREYINDRLAIRDTAFKARLAYQIESRASGVFFWVVLVVRLIKKRCDGGASHSEISKSLQEILKKLQELIGAILHSPDNALLRTMRWILFSLKSLSLEELYFAIRTGIGQLTSGVWNTSEVDRDDMKAFILTSSRGLVEIEPWHGSSLISEAQLVHESVREYLITGGLKDPGPSSNKMVEANNHARLFHGPWSSLLELAARRCPSLLQSILDQGAVVNFDGEAPLCTAVELCGGCAFASELWGTCTSVDVPQNCLGPCYQKRYSSLVTSLLEHDADANGARGTRAISPLLAALGHKASQEERWLSDIPPVKEYILRALLDHEADVNLRAGPKRISPL